jgi:hypothetical protein
MMKTRCTYTHHDGSVYSGLWPHERLAISAYIDYNDKDPLKQIIRNGKDHKQGIMSEGMGYFIDDYLDGAIKRQPSKRTAYRDLEVYLFIQDLKDIGDNRPLRSGRSTDGLATLAAEQFGIEEDAAVKAYQRVKKDQFT